MNAKQTRFVQEYLKDLNATQAAIRAGYSEESAWSVGSRLTRNAEVAQAIAKGSAAAAIEVRRSVKLTKRRVVEELKTLAFSNIDHYDIDDFGHVQLAEGAPTNAMAAISAIDRSVTVHEDGSKTYNVKLKFWDKPGTLKLAGRHVEVKGFSDRTELTGKNGGPIQVTAMTAEEAARELAAIEAEARGEVIDVTPAEKPKEGA